MLTAQAYSSSSHFGVYNQTTMLSQLPAVSLRKVVDEKRAIKQKRLQKFISTAVKSYSTFRSRRMDEKRIGKMRSVGRD